MPLSDERPVGPEAGAAAAGVGASGATDGVEDRRIAARFPPLPIAEAVDPPTRPLRVCIITPDIVGPVRNGGIGTAYTDTARLLARAGHSVTILYTLGQFTQNGPIDEWIARYAQDGITLVPLPDAPIPGGKRLGKNIERAYAAYEWMKTRDFDLVHTTEWSGHSYYCLVAKHLGLAFHNTIFAVKTSSPALWSLIGNRELIRDLTQLITMYIERRSVELADVVISPSQHMLSWMKDNAYELPLDACFVQPNIFSPPPSASRSRATRRNVTELVFFGRLEPRKGLHVFLDALRRLPGEVTRQVSRVCFLGKRSPRLDADSVISQHLSGFDVPWEIIDNLGQPDAVSFLNEEGRLAVIPSLLDNSPFTIYECLALRIPFLSTDVGGIAELVLEGYRDDVLCAPHPHSLAALLERTVRAGAVVAEPSFDFAENNRRWLAWHAGLGSEKAKDSTISGAGSFRPLVSVCIIHRNRPALLAQALASIEVQTYDNYEVILVDDGSTSPDVETFLSEIEPSFAERGWTIIRQENLYVGASRNSAARAARGTYLLLMDDDNCAKPNALECFVRAAEHSGADILTCFGDVFAGVNPPEPDLVAERRTVFVGADLSYGLFRNGFGDANAFVRTSAFREIGGFSEDFRVGLCDHEFFARAVWRGLQLHVVPEPLYWYREHDLGRMREMQTHQGAAHRLRVLRPYLAALPSRCHNILRTAVGLHEELASTREAMKVLDARLKRSQKRLARSRKALKQSRTKARSAQQELQAFRPRRPGPGTPGDRPAYLAFLRRLRRAFGRSPRRPLPPRIR